MNHPKVIHNVSMTQLSIARHYGGCTFNGKRYVYCDVDDTLTLESEMPKEYRIVEEVKEGGKWKMRWKGDPFKTARSAKKAMEGDRSGNNLMLFGPKGMMPETMMCNGELALIKEYQAKGTR